ncbi:MAG TPA: DUF2062 domain-containing protein [Steroidobacteraceae bacterium]|nr:DUF2062 domain-containing protein [Steroidobacteraceae bacterium]
MPRPRKLIKRLSQLIHQRRHHWYLSVFGDHLTDSHLWSLNRHSITAAFGVGIGVSFIPLPLHLPLVVLAAIWWRLNVAVAIAGSYFVNPFTMVPVYFGAYRVGALLLRYAPRHFVFHLSWNWLEHGLGPAWKPFLLGCLVCGIGCGLIGRYTLELLWREVTMRRYRARQRQREQDTAGSHVVSRP